MAKGSSGEDAVKLNVPPIVGEGALEAKAGEPSADSGAQENRSIGEVLKEVVASPAFAPGLALLAAIAVLLWPLWPRIYKLWMSEDGYYSHGFLVPFISGFIVYKWWPWLSKIPVRPFYWGFIPLAAVLYVMRIANLSLIEGLLSVGLMAVLLLTAWIVAGGRWMLALAAPILYLSFALPMLSAIINNVTNPLQVVSTVVSKEILTLFGYTSIFDGPTVIQMNSYRLDVAVPCSGLKLVLALTAFTVFFVLIGRMKMLSNFIMLVMVLPLAIFINGLRIALIGMVGENYGEMAAKEFHDYSGYITLIVCFFILFKIARTLGWKD